MIDRTPSRRFRRVEKDPYGGWIARDKFGVEYIEPGFRWNCRSSARDVVDSDRMFGDLGVEAHAAELRARAAEALAARSPSTPITKTKGL